jgi:TPR repeat protein
MQRPVLRPARVHWRVVLLAGFASAVTVACLSWLSGASSPDDAAVAVGTAYHADASGAAASPAQGTRMVGLPMLMPVRTSAPRAEPAGDLASPPEQTARSTPEQAPAPAPAEAMTSASEVSGAAAEQSAPPQAMIGLLTQRGDAALAVGDIIAARLLYERAATMGSATAATAAGKTFDLDFLLRADTHGIRPDPGAAATWYRKAVALGDPTARTLLAHLEARSRQ